MNLKNLHIYFFLFLLPIASMLSADCLFAHQSSGQRSISIDEYANKIFFSNIFIKAKNYKKEFYVGEPIVVEYELYVNDKIILTEVLDEKAPEFNDALVEEEDIGTLRYTYETIRGEVFRKALIRKYVVISTKEGIFDIPELSLKINASLEYSPEFPTDERYYSRINTYSSEKIQVNVKPILEADETYIGAVGNFSINSLIGRDTVSVGRNFEFVIEIIGSGNLYLINAPKLKLPNFLQIVGEPNVVDSIKIKNGIFGKRTFVYAIKALKEGNFVVPEQLVSYFDPQKKKFVSLKTQPHNIEAIDTDEIEQSHGIESRQSDYLSWILVVLGLLALLALIYLLRKINSGSEGNLSEKEINTQPKQNITDEIRNFSNSSREIVLDFLFKSIMEALVNKLHLKKDELSVEKIRGKMIEKKFDNNIIDKVVNYLNELKRLRFYKIDEQIDIEVLKERGIEIIEKIERGKKNN
ncbi:MAG TPA: BatD family protein [Candidatus Kapabacteria bacterium]|nr:BatD family protein [Candidatus Kapabacteria bacterium]